MNEPKTYEIKNITIDESIVVHQGSVPEANIIIAIRKG